MTSTYPADFFGAAIVKPKVGYCFVLMPFKAGLTEVFETVRATLQSQPWNFECKRADDFFGGGHILGDILQGIGEAQILIADLTDRNPNVFYELGIAHMVRKPDDIILLTQNMESIPFDLQSFRCIQYSQTIEGAHKLQTDLARALQEMVDPIYRFSIEQMGTYDFPDKLRGDLNCLYDFSVYGDYLGVDGAKLTLQIRRFTAGRPSPEILPKEYHGLGRGGSIKVPCIPWELRLENTGRAAADFSLVHCAAELGTGAKTPKRVRALDKEPYSTVSLRGDIASDARSSSTWISLSTRKDFKKGQRLRLILGSPSDPKKREAKRVLIRFLRDDDDESEPVGIVTPRGLPVPKDRIVKLTIPADFAKVRMISVHGGPNPWKRFPLGANNGLPTLVSAALTK